MWGVVPVDGSSRGQNKARPTVDVGDRNQEEEKFKESEAGWESPKHRPWKSANIVEEDGENMLLSPSTQSVKSPSQGRRGSEGGEDPWDEADEAIYHDLRVLFSYASDDERMLELREGEMVRVVAEQDGWFFAIDCNGSEGFVPPDYLEPLDEAVEDQVTGDLPVET